MDYEVNEIDDGVVVKGVKNFDLEHIFECGQAFRWYRNDNGSYTGTAKGKAITVEKEGEDLIIHNTSLDDFNNIWYYYFDMARDYGEVKAELSKDEVLKEAIRHGEGIRILKQDEWEILISFIISANNRIPMIKRTIGRISERWGTPIELMGKTYYAFPGPDELSKATTDELEGCGAGFRSKYIKATAQIVYNGDIDIYNLKNIGYAKARSELMKLPGVGPKVSDCILLFSMGYHEAFPVDIWVKRVMQYFYLAPDVSLPKIEKFAQDKFGSLSGFAQEYLFYYARTVIPKDLVK